MNDRAAKYEAFLDELAPVVDGEQDALERHADFLADDDEARDLRHESADVAAQLRDAGADYVPPPDLEARLMAALDGGPSAGGRSTSPGFAAPDEARRAMEERSPGDPTLAATLPAPVASQSVASQSVASQSVASQSVAAPVAPQAVDPTLAATRPAGPSEVPHTETRNVASPPKKSARGRVIAVSFVGVAALAAAGLLAVMLSGGEGDTPPAPALAIQGIEGSLQSIDRAADDGQSGVAIQRPGSDGFVALAAGEAVPAGATVRTDDRTRARLMLADGSKVVLNHATELALMSDAPRSFRIARGDSVADIAHIEGAPHVFFHTDTGQVEVLGTKLELAVTADVTNVRVSRGVVSVASKSGGTAEVREGEEALLRPEGEPQVAPVADMARAMAWSELGGEVRRSDDVVLPGIGSLRAHRPGEHQDHDHPLTLAQHSVRVRIVGNVARTEIEEVFSNDGDHTLEGVYRFPLPADAQIARLALDVDGEMQDGSFVERDRAARIWRGVIRNATPRHQRRNDEEFIWVPGPWHDPAILEWQRGGQFELRVFPIPAHGERRVILAYTQTVPPDGGERRYVYPLAHSADGSTRIGRFDVDVRVAGAERVNASGYRVTSAAEDDATRLRMSEEGFMPKGDLVVEYELPGAQRELSYWTYRGDAAAAPPEHSREQDREVLDAQRQLAEDARPYVAFSLRPQLPRATARRDRDYVIVVDSSQSMVGERYQRASELAARVVGELDRRDRFAVLACDYACRAMPGGVQAPSGQAAAQAAQWLGSVQPAGASDLVAVLREAVANVRGQRQDGRELEIIYVGDGTATVGYRRAASLAQEVRELADGEHVAVSTVGVGNDADTLALSAIARAGGGHYLPYVPGERTSVAAMSVVESTYGVSLEAPRVELPDGLSDVAPAELPTIRAGEEVTVVARMDWDRVDGNVVLHGTVAGRPFEQRYAVQLVPTDAAGNRFVPRLWAAGRIEELQLGGRGEDRAKVIALSKAYGVMSRYTSLLVLESEAMFRAFRVDRNESAPEWTGEEDVVEGGADGALEVAGGVLAEGQATGGRGGYVLPGRVARHSRRRHSAAPAARPRAADADSRGRDERLRWRWRCASGVERVVDGAELAVARHAGARRPGCSAGAGAAPAPVPAAASPARTLDAPRLVSRRRDSGRAPSRPPPSARRRGGPSRRWRRTRTAVTAIARRCGG